MNVLKAVIWTRVNGTPEKMGDLSLINNQSIFSYHSDYKGAGFSLLGSKELWGDNDINYPASERVPVSPPLINHIPGRNPRNLQRSVLLDVIKKQTGQEPPQTIETEWKLLQLGGHGSIGHLDVFTDDMSAQSFYEYENKRQRHPAESLSGVWDIVKRNVNDQAIEINTNAMALMGGTPSVGGMIPKMLASMEKGSNKLFPPDTKGYVDMVVKFEAPEHKGLMALEAMCLDIHKESGINTASFRRFDVDGIEALAVKRFDRKYNHQVLPLESLFSLLATSDHQIRGSFDVTLEGLGKRINKIRRLLDIPKDTEEKLFQRILMAWATGNGDLHLQNTSILGSSDNCKISPVYDPAPMRAWPHQLASAIPYNPENPKPFINIGLEYGLTNRKVKEVIDKALQDTKYYHEQIKYLKGVPDDRKELLISVTKKTKRQLVEELDLGVTKYNPNPHIEKRI